MKVGRSYIGSAIYKKEHHQQQPTPTYNLSGLPYRWRALCSSTPSSRGSTNWSRGRRFATTDLSPTTPGSLCRGQDLTALPGNSGCWKGVVCRLDKVFGKMARFVSSIYHISCISSTVNTILFICLTLEITVLDVCCCQKFEACGPILHPEDTKKDWNSLFCFYQNKRVKHVKVKMNPICFLEPPCCPTALTCKFWCGQALLREPEIQQLQAERLRGMLHEYRVTDYMDQAIITIPEINGNHLLEPKAHGFWMVSSNS